MIVPPFLLSDHPRPLFFFNYHRSDVFISQFRQFAVFVFFVSPACFARSSCSLCLWACGVGGLPLRRYSLRVRADYSRVPSVIFYTSATSWRIERCRPARDTSNADVAHADSSLCFFPAIPCGVTFVSYCGYYPLYVSYADCQSACCTIGIMPSTSPSVSTASNAVSSDERSGLESWIFHKNTLFCAFSPLSLAYIQNYYYLCARFL